MNNNMSKFDKLTEAYIKVVKESSYNLYTDILNPLHTILNVDED
jgi:energy-converting hydrogenase A subunit M